jgi:hypothetical protein
MTVPEVIKCPDGHFRRAVYGLGPYIADYLEQVWLSGIVQGWCPKYISFLSRVLSLSTLFPDALPDQTFLMTTVHAVEHMRRQTC